MLYALLYAGLRQAPLLSAVTYPGGLVLPCAIRLVSRESSHKPVPRTDYRDLVQ